MNAQISLIALAASLVMAGAASRANDIPIVPDLVEQVQALRNKGDALGARVGPDLPDPNADFNFHWQGITRHPNANLAVMYATLSYPCYDGGGALAVIDISWADSVDGARLRSNRLSGQPLGTTLPRTQDRIVNVLRFPTIWHPGGVQAAGNYMAIGLETDTSYGCVDGEGTYIYDISDPYNPVEYAFASDWGAGVIGFTQRADGKYVVVQASGYGSNGTQFLLSDGETPENFTVYAWSGASLIDEDPEHVAQWPTEENDTYVHQALSLFAGTDYPGTPNRTESLYMLGLRNRRQDGLGKDVLVVYGVELNSSLQTATVWQITERELPTDATGHFNAAAGAWAAPDGELLIYKTPYHNTGPGGTFAFVEHSSMYGLTLDGAPGNECNAHVQLFEEPGLIDHNANEHSIGVDALDVLYEDYSNLINVDPVVLMNDTISSVLWTLPVGCTCRLYNGAGFNGSYLELVGTGAPQWHSDLALVPWTSGTGDADNKISSLRFFGDCPGRGYFTDPGPYDSTIATTLPLLAPGDVCSVLKLFAGHYTTAGVTMTQPVTLHAVGGLATIGP